MRRRAGVAGFLVAALTLVACGGGEPLTDATQTTAAASRDSCSSSPESPFSGLSAVTPEGVVHVWVRPGADGRIEFAGVGDDPAKPPTEGDGSFVESVAVAPSTCAVFIALCCEPVSGLTKWYPTPGSDPIDLYGRLPAVSPDGERVALVGYDTVTVRSVADPTVEGASIGLPVDGSSVVLDMMWLDGDRLVILVNTGGSLLLHEAVISEGTIRPGVALGAGVEPVSALLVGLIDGTFRVSERSEAAFLIESFDPSTLESLGSEPVDPASPFVRRAGNRTVSITRDSTLIAHADGQIDPTPLGSGYWWAG